MSDQKYVMVPVEPTAAMRSPWKTMRGYSWHDKYKAMLAAAPAVQGEPVAAPHTAEQQPTISDEIPARTTFGGPQRFTVEEQQPAPDVAGGKL